ncbi:MAG: pyridoxamine 5'-phosphate oxidase family protein [Ruminococcus sp.]|nr:pyridoxamine 5'-phosphate oxidase family protein [Ruminococcus sp.]
MRRSDREVTDAAAVEQFIAEQQILRVGFCDNGEVYIVPVNYGYTCDNGKYTFYFHGAKAGRKYTLAKASPTVGFELDGAYAPLPAEKACNWSATFQSVIGTGTLTVAEDKAEKIEGLNHIMAQASGRSDWSYSEKMLDAVAVFCLRADKLTCKAKK